MIEYATSTTDNETDKENENKADDNTTNEHKSENISHQHKIELLSVKMEALPVKKIIFLAECNQILKFHS